MSCRSRRAETFRQEHGKHKAETLKLHRAIRDLEQKVRQARHKRSMLIARLARVGIDVFGDSYDARYAREQIDPRRADPGVAVHAALPQTTLWEAMARAAVVLCPARWEEPFGMVAAEAQACGTPVVAFRRGALPEVILDGTTGFLVEPDDHQAAAEAVSRAPALSRAACREHAEADLDIERSLDAHERLYARVAGARLGARARA